MIFWESS